MNGSFVNFYHCLGMLTKGFEGGDFVASEKNGEEKTQGQFGWKKKGKSKRSPNQRGN